MQSHLQKLPPMAANLRRDDNDKRRETTTDDERRRETTTDDDRRRDDASQANTAPTPRPPTINGNPSLRIREKEANECPKCQFTSKSWKLSPSIATWQLCFWFGFATLRPQFVFFAAGKGFRSKTVLGSKHVGQDQYGHIQINSGILAEFTKRAMNVKVNPLSLYSTILFLLCGQSVSADLRGNTTEKLTCELQTSTLYTHTTRRATQTIQFVKCTL